MDIFSGHSADALKKYEKALQKTANAKKLKKKPPEFETQEVFIIDEQIHLLHYPHWNRWNF